MTENDVLEPTPMALSLVLWLQSPLAESCRSFLLTESFWRCSRAVHFSRRMETPTAVRAGTNTGNPNQGLFQQLFQARITFGDVHASGSGLAT